MLVLTLTPCVLQVSAAGEVVSLKRKRSSQRSGQRLTGQRQPRRPPALHLPQAGVPQVCKAVQLPAPGGQDGKPVYPLPGNQGDDEVGTNRLPYLHQVSETSLLWLGFRQPGDQPDIWLAPAPRLPLGESVMPDWVPLGWNWPSSWHWAWHIVHSCSLNELMNATDVTAFTTLCLWLKNNSVLPWAGSWDQRWIVAPWTQTDLVLPKLGEVLPGVHGWVLSVYEATAEKQGLSFQSVIFRREKLNNSVDK